MEHFKKKENLKGLKVQFNKMYLLMIDNLQLMILIYIRYYKIKGDKIIRIKIIIMIAKMGFLLEHPTL
jgi:hypothetical protein